MTFDQWSKEVSKGISFQCDESPRGLDSIFQLVDEDFEDEELPGSPLKKE